MICDGVHTFIYNELNQITQVEDNGKVVATYGYDSSNRRIIKTIGSRTTHYLYDNNNQLIAETLADGTPLRDYIYLNGEPIALNEYQKNPGLYYYLNDHLGTPQQLVTGSGNVVWQAVYLPFGEAQVAIEQVSSNIRFPGQYYDSETGLHYNWHRFYDPETGRYISADPIGFGGGDLNLYSYVYQDPINWIDPKGLFGDGVAAGGEHLGHMDFSGANKFDYAIEDTGDTSPFVDPERHFRPLGQSEQDVQRAIDNCDKDAFQRAMHRGQDYYSHYAKGYRWKPFQQVWGLGLGHALDGTLPDEDIGAWIDAEDWSQKWLKKWEEKCECKPKNP